MTLRDDDSPAEQREDPGTPSLAIALKYDLHPDHVPRVVATGRGELADSILAVAFAAGVKVRADADLAELLGVVDVGDDIPGEAFVAIAEVLSYVYRANGKMKILEDQS